MTTDGRHLRGEKVIGTLGMGKKFAGSCSGELNLPLRPLSSGDQRCSTPGTTADKSRAGSKTDPGQKNTMKGSN